MDARVVNVVRSSGCFLRVGSVGELVDALRDRCVAEGREFVATFVTRHWDEVSREVRAREGERTVTSGRRAREEGSEREEEEGGREHAGRGHDRFVALAEGMRKCTHQLARARAAACMLNLARACRRRHGHPRVLVAKPLDRLGAGWYEPRGLRGFCGLRGLHSLFGERWSRAGAKGAPGRTP